MGNNLEEASKFLILEEAHEVEDWLTTPPSLQRGSTFIKSESGMIFARGSGKTVER